MSDSQAADQRHLVVALKYRPQTFQSLVGQDHIATALGNAIKQNRVGHAYLFTGARGVGKTSSARIFTKCLNCEKGPSPVPCEECETCQAISVGEDVDVIEIDGASNRGIDEIRQLRANAAVRAAADLGDQRVDRRRGIPGCGWVTALGGGPKSRVGGMVLGAGHRRVTGWVGRPAVCGGPSPLARSHRLCA